MKALDESDFPIKHQMKLEFTEADVKAFQNVLHQQSSAIPPTLWVKALKGVFALIDELQIDWRKLLHVSQRFEYRNPLPIPVKVNSEARLVRMKSRAGAKWLYFENELTAVGSTDVGVFVEALIVVQDG